jgi:CheY-like chemotaxis protein
MKDNRSLIHVLLTDDDADEVMLFQEAIKEIPFLVKLSSAENGYDLLKVLENNQPNLIFLDLNMPGKSGKECLQEIRLNPVFHDIPVIIYSTSNNRDDIDTCYKHGANLYIVKPQLFRDIVKALEKVLSIDWNKRSRVSKEQFVLIS